MNDPQLSPLEANRMLDCLKSKPVRLMAIEELMQAPLTPETRKALRSRYLAETETETMGSER